MSQRAVPMSLWGMESTGYTTFKSQGKALNKNCRWVIFKIIVFVSEECFQQTDTVTQTRDSSLLSEKGNRNTRFLWLCSFEKQDSYDFASTSGHCGKTCQPKPCTRQDGVECGAHERGGRCEDRGLFPPCGHGVGSGPVTSRMVWRWKYLPPVLFLEAFPLDTRTGSYSKPFCHPWCLVSAWSFSRNRGIGE